MFIIFLGPPGAGKGTQAGLLAKKLEVPHISTGDLFRDEMKRGTPLGKQIIYLMNSGQLVSDKITMEVLKLRLAQPDCSQGAILDGVPRTIVQAQVLDVMFKSQGKKLDHVIYIELPTEEIIVRLSGRWTCKQCGRVYHEKYDPPQEVGVCDLDNGPLYQREDQKEGAIKERIKVYRELTAPLIKYYKDKDLLLTVSGHDSIEVVNAAVLEKLHLQA